MIRRLLLTTRGPGPKDNPDNTGGVGPDHVVSCTDANVLIHDRRTGEVLQRMTQTEFWKNARPGFELPKLNDPRMTYDPLAGRWYTVVQAALVGPLRIPRGLRLGGPHPGLEGGETPDGAGQSGHEAGLRQEWDLHHVHRDDRRHPYHARLPRDPEGRCRRTAPRCGIGRPSPPRAALYVPTRPAGRPACMPTAAASSPAMPRRRRLPPGPGYSGARSGPATVPSSRKASSTRRTMTT